jgi:putative transposase
MRWSTAPGLSSQDDQHSTRRASLVVGRDQHIGIRHGNGQPVNAVSLGHADLLPGISLHEVVRSIRGERGTRKQRFSGQRIIGNIKAHGAGAKVAALRRHGSPTLYNWKAKYGGLDVSEAERLEALEEDNRRLKKLLGEQLLDNAALKDLVGEKI